MTDLTARTQYTEGGCSRALSLTDRITEILDDAVAQAKHDAAQCGPNAQPEVDTAHIADLIVAEMRREEREIDYGLGARGTEKRKQVRYTTPWETQP